MTGPEANTRERWRRPRPVRVVLDIADRALRADIAEACEDAGIVVAAEAADAEVVLIDRPVATAVPAVALAPDGTRMSSDRFWPASVRAIVPADTDAETLAAIITVVAAGYALTAATADAEQDADDSDDSGEDGPASLLTAREREVLTLLACGASNKEIALALALSVSTVKFHVAAIIDKLGARSRVDAAAIAVRTGLVMV